MSGAAGARQTNRVKTQASLARALGVSRATVTKWVADGLEAEPDGSFDVKKGLAWKKFTATKMKAGTSRTKPAQASDEEYRKYKAALMKQEFEVSSGKLIACADISREWSLLLLQIRDSFLYLGREIAPQLVGRSVREIQATIDKRVMQVLGQLSAEPKTIGKAVRA